MPYALNDTISTAPIEGGIEITEQQYADAFAAKLSGRETAVLGGELVIRDPTPSPEHIWENGEWVAPEPTEPEPPSQGELWAALRAERDRLLAETDKLMLRHADEVALELTPTLSGQQYAELLVYRQALRDLPESTEDPAEPVWPVKPVG